MYPTEEERLEGISKEYITPDSGMQIDRKIIGMIVEGIIPWLQGPEILELGFDHDQWTARIVEVYGHSHIVDASEGLLERARSRYAQKVTTYGSLFEDFQPGPRFDTILASLVLEHVEDPVQILRKTRSWLKGGG